MKARSICLTLGTWYFVIEEKIILDHIVSTGLQRRQRSLILDTTGSKAPDSMAGGTKRTITGRTHGDSHQHDKREDKEDSLTSLGTREMKLTKDEPFDPMEILKWKEESIFCQQLIKILSNYCETGKNEGPIETLNRIIEDAEKYKILLEMTMEDNVWLLDTAFEKMLGSKTFQKILEGEK